MDMDNIIAQFANEADGIAAQVLNVERGFLVRLVDTDADAILQSFTIHPTLEGAVASAKKIAGTA